MRLLLLTVCCSINALSQEMWLCSTQSSQMQGNSILACGVGEGNAESVARKNALSSAREEFNGLCDAGSECALHRHSAIPGRSTCEKKDGYWKCYRLVTYRVLPDLSTQAPNAIQVAQQEARDDLQYDKMTEQELLDLSYRQKLLKTLR